MDKKRIDHENRPTVVVLLDKDGALGILEDSGCRIITVDYPALFHGDCNITEMLDKDELDYLKNNCNYFYKSHLEELLPKEEELSASPAP